ncbi:unnamed protein product, partial [Effrenium voratum]
ENRLVNLNTMPKKPKSVYALFREDIKEEVPAGKGEGKGMKFVKNKFEEMDEEAKQKYKEKEAELKQKYNEEVKDFKEGTTFKEFKKTEEKIKREMMTEAMKVMTLKFLNDAPAEPPRNPFSIFVGEKRKASVEEAGEPKKKKSKQEAKDEVAAFKAEWGKLDKDMKSVYDEKQKEARKKWQEEVKAYMELPKWQEYVEEAKALRVPVRGLLSKKKKSIKKLKNGMKLLPLPDRPETMPSKPPKAKRIFFQEKRKEVEDPAKLSEMWDALTEEERKVWDKKAADLEMEYQEELKAFHESDEGREFLKRMSQVRRSRACAVAKDKHLAGVQVPKKPPGALDLYGREKVKELKKAKPELKGADLKKEITECWKAFSDEEKTVYQDKAKGMQQEYEEKLRAFKETENFKSYQAAMRKFMKSNKKPQGKGGGKGKPKANLPAPPPKPESMPAKPGHALKLYMKEQAGSGKKIPEMASAFRELPDEEKARFKEMAETQLKEYEEKMEEWLKTDEGKKYARDTKNVQKRRKVAIAKDKFLKDEPKKPPTPLAIFSQEKRGEFAEKFPESKGLMLNSKIAEAFRGLSEDERKEWDDKAKGKQDEYEEKMEEFKKTPEYKKYQSAVRSTRPAPKGKAKAKPKGPPVPDTMPKKPPAAMMLFMKANKGGGKLQQQVEAWKALDAEEQKKFKDEAKEKMEQYEEDMAEFRKSAEGKKYYRLQAAAGKKSRVEQARQKYLGQEDAPKAPKMPPGAYQLFVQDKRPTLAGKSMQEVAKELSALWSQCSAEDKKPFEEKAAELKEDYEEKLKEYKNSDAYKQFDKAQKSIQKTQGSRKPKSKAKPRKAKAKAKPKAKAGRKPKAAATKADSDSDSDVMGSDSDSSSSSSDSD